MKNYMAGADFLPESEELMKNKGVSRSLWMLVLAAVCAVFLLPAMLPAAVLAADKVCTTEAEAAKAVRAYLVKRQAEFSIPVRLKVKNASEAEDKDKLMDTVMERIRDKAFAETDKPYEGDYMHQLKGYSAMSDGKWNGDIFSGTLEYTCPLMSTAAQEKAVDAAVAKIMKKLALNGKSEYEKVRAIYDYICGHSAYDFAEEDTDEAHTAYAILVKGKGKCEAYSQALYRLMREAGIGCRCISGNVKGTYEGHAWNLVRIGKVWYYVDATWDTSYYTENYPYRYFLKGSKDKSYLEHEEFIIELPNGDPDFWKKYPLSESDYPYTDPRPVTPAPDVPGIPGVPVIINGTNGLSLFWKADPAAISYSVLRRANGGAMKTIATTKETDYFDRKVKSGNAYTYYLVANGKDGYQSPKSGPHRVYYLSTPYDLKARAAGSRTAVLIWKKVRGASGYQIRYSVKKNMKSAKWVFVKKGSTLKKEIKKLRKKKYYFQIRAYRNVPGYKVYSAWGPKTVRKIR